jgi:hypothetical protein
VIWKGSSRKFKVPEIPEESTAILSRNTQLYLSPTPQIQTGKILRNISLQSKITRPKNRKIMSKRNRNIGRGIKPTKTLDTGMI